MAKGKVKAKLKSAVKSIKAEAHKVTEAVTKVAEKVLEKADPRDLPFAPLLPFKGVMRDALHSSNVEHTDHLHDIVPKFHNHIVKANHFDDAETTFYGNQNFALIQEEDTYPMRGNFNLSDSTKALASSAVSAASSAAVGNIGGMVTVVFNYIKGLVAKKKSGAPMTKQEEQILKSSETVAATIQSEGTNLVEESISERIKEFMFSWKGGVTIAAIILLIVVAIRKTGK